MPSVRQKHAGAREKSKIEGGSSEPNSTGEARRDYRHFDHNSFVADLNRDGNLRDRDRDFHGSHIAPPS